jgi:putative aldouronate transport system substrate-binding protein
MKKLSKRLCALVLSVMMLLSAAAVATAEGSLADQPPVDITMLMITSGINPPDLDLVLEKVYEIVREKLNINLTIKTVGYTDFAQMIPLMLATNEDLDLFQSFSMFNSFLGNGYLKDVSEEINAYGQDILDIAGDYIGMASVGDKCYGVPSMKDLAAGTGLVIRKDLVDKYSIDLSAVQTLDDVTEMFRTIKNSEDIAGLSSVYAGRGVVMLPSDLFDDLGTGTLIGLKNPEDGTKIVNYYAMPEYAEMLDYIYMWNQEGLFVPDGIESGANLVRAGRSFSYQTGTKPGIQLQEELNVGLPVVIWEYPAKPLIKTFNYWTWSVSANCKYPDRAVQLLNLLFKDKEINNLLAWGIEGMHYVFADKENGVITYPEGVDANTVGYNLWTRFGLPNNFLQYVMEGNSPTLWEETKVFNDTAVVSNALGFIFDTEPVINEMTAIKNVTAQYAGALETGEVDPAVMLPEFLDALNDAGIGRVIEECQAQFDAWLAAK